MSNTSIVWAPSAGATLVHDVSSSVFLFQSAGGANQCQHLVFARSIITAACLRGVPIVISRMTNEVQHLRTEEAAVSARCRCQRRKSTCPGRTESSGSRNQPRSFTRTCGSSSPIDRPMLRWTSLSRSESCFDHFLHS